MSGIQEPSVVKEVKFKVDNTADEQVAHFVESFLVVHVVQEEWQ